MYYYKVKYYEGIFDSSYSPKQIWRSINILLGKGKSKAKLYSIKDEFGLLIGDSSVAHSFNSFYANVDKNLANNISLKMLLQGCTSAIGIPKIIYNGSK